MIVSIFGQSLAPSAEFASTVPLPTQLGTGKTQVFIQGRPAGLFYVSPTQINAQVPWETSGPALVVVLTEGTTSNTLPVFFGDAFPEIFAIESSGTALAAATSVSGELINSNNPARPGQPVVVWCNGLGPLRNPIPSGAASRGPDPLDGDVQIQIGAQAATPDYAGAAPGFVGLNQVQFRIPKDGLFDGRNRLALRPLVKGLPYESINPVELSVRNDPSRLTPLNASYKGTFLLGNGASGSAVLSELAASGGTVVGRLTLIDGNTGITAEFSLRGKLPGDTPTARFEVVGRIGPFGSLALQFSAESLEAQGLITEEGEEVQGQVYKLRLVRTF